MTTKRILLLATFFMLTAFAVHVSAQTPAAPVKIVINPQAGITLSNLSTDPTFAEHKYRAGYEFGGYVRIGSPLFFQPGIFWNRMGVKLETFEAIKDQRTFKIDVNSIQIPALLGVYIVDAGLFRLRAAGGGVVSFVTSVNSNPLFTKDDLKKTRWALRGDVGADILMFTADVGYDYGLTDFFQEPLGGEAKMRSWFFNVGIAF